VPYLKEKIIRKYSNSDYYNAIMLILALNDEYFYIRELARKKLMAECDNQSILAQL